MSRIIIIIERGGGGGSVGFLIPLITVWMSEANAA